ncbi:hypothetical protein BLA9940_01188 [Burkholderia aenigmatica]|uniref:hypothetical protein n=1 Tax=Burkholderia cepacia complex TaxID=87882 RepID=UPI000F08AF49|nr:MULTISPECIES: hypothetical protein [Burkholderia cepacia complex]AYQ38536.1 hypothetical protein CVS37_10765 [Burkholderia lata]VWC47475.1 hypothetical protein BLA9940_01188 [Burkholderia aenigmatica]
MALYDFSLDGTGIDSGSVDPSGADASTLYGIYGPDSTNSNYTYTTAPDTSNNTSVPSTLGQMQTNGSTDSSGSNGALWLSGFQSLLGAAVAGDAIANGLTAQGTVPVYRAPNGVTYPVGSGPSLTHGNGLGMLLLIGLVVLLLDHEGGR